MKFSLPSRGRYAVIALCLIALSGCNRGPQDQADPTTLVRESLDLEGPLTVEPLRGGLSGYAKLFLVSTENQKYVLRMISKTSSEVSHELACLQTASKAGYGPHVYVADPHRGFIIMEFLPSQRISREDRQSTQLYQALGKAVSKVHHGPAFPEGCTIFDLIRQNLSRLKNYVQYKKTANQMEELLSIVHSSLAKYTKKASCHNDLNPNNMLWSGSSFKIIDYEHACQDDPYFDLATLITFYCFKPEHEQILLGAYFGRPMTREENAHLYLAKQEFFLSYASLLFLKHPEVSQDWGTAPEKYEDLLMKINGKQLDLEEPTAKFRFARSLLAEVKKNLDSQQFQDAVKLSDSANSRRDDDRIFGNASTLALRVRPAMV